MENVVDEGTMVSGKPQSDLEKNERAKCNERLLQLRLRLEAKHSRVIESAAVALKNELSEASNAARCQIQERTMQLVPFLDDTIKEINAAMEFKDVDFLLEEKWHTHINEWKSEIWIISKKLSVSCTQSLIAYKKRLINAKLYPMEAVNSLIDNFTSEINKILLCNERDYLETESHLRKVYGTFAASWHKKQAYKLIQAISLYKNQDPEDLETNLESTPVEIVMNCLKNLANELVKPYEVPFPDTLMISNLIIYLSHLGLCKEHIVHFHCLAIDIVKMQTAGWTGVETDLQNFEKLWSDAIGSIKRQFEETRKYVSESIQNWNHYIVKLQKIECVTARVLHRYRKNCSKLVVNFEEHLNVLFDKLREANDLLDLRIICEQICFAFQNIEQTRKSMRNDEDKIHNQSMTTYFANYDLLAGDLTILDLEVNESVFQDSLPSEDIDELEMIQLCLTNAKNWFYAFRATMKLLQREVLNFLNEFLGNWMAYKKGESEFFLRLDLERLNQRKSRTVQNILEVRWSELLEHNKALEMFAKGIDVEFKLLTKNFQSLKDELKELDRELASVLVSYIDQKSDEPLTILYLNRIEKRWHEVYKVKKENKVKRSKEEVARVFLWMKHLAVTFLSSIKLFGEGGNYSPEEATAMVGKLSTVQKKVKKLQLKITSKLDLIASNTSENIAEHIGHQLTTKESLALAKLQSQHVIDLRLDKLQKRLDEEIIHGRGVISTLNELSRTTEKGRNCEFLQSIARIVGDSCYYFGLPNFPLQIDIEKIVKKDSIKPLGDQVKFEGFRRMTDFLIMGFLHRNESLKRTSSSASLGMCTTDVEPRVCSIRKNRQEHGLSSKKRGAKTKNLRKITPKKRRIKSKVSGNIGAPRTSHAVETWIESDEPDHGCAYNFLMTMKTRMLETYQDIKRIIERTYIVTYGIPEEYAEPLKDDYLCKIRKINLHCEISWNALLLEFISSLLRVIQLLPECANVELNEAFEEWTTKKNIRTNELENKIDSFNIESEKKKIDAELKPWHGHPLNKSILQKLLRKVYETCQDQLTRRKNVLEKFQDEIIEFWLEQKESKAVLVSRTSEINDLIFVNPSVRRFVEMLLSFTSRFNKFDETKLEKTSHAMHLKCIKEYLHIVDEAASENRVDPAIQVSEKEIEGYRPEELEQISGNIMQFIKNLKVIHRALQELIQTGYFPPSEADAEAQEDEFVSAFFMEFQKKIESSHKRLKSEISQTLQNCKKEFDEANDNLTRWKDEWIYHVKNVIRLYSVDPILEGPHSSIKRLVNQIKPRNAIPYSSPPFE